MRLLRARHEDRVVLARREGQTAWILADERRSPGADVLRDALLDERDLAAGGRRVTASALQPLSPVGAPGKIICAGLNYPLHAQEASADLPAAPLLFAKTANALCGPGDEILLPAGISGEVDYEAELVAVIGRRAARVAPTQALDHVLGFTAGNDVSARDVQFADGQWFRGKSFDTFAPIGPELVTTDAFTADARIVCRVNGTVLQDASTAEMLFDVATLVSHASQTITLEPGDLVFTGTPDGVGIVRQPPVFLRDGDVVEVEIDGIGVLSNRVRAVD